jgi:hypothetical protein
MRKLIVALMVVGLMAAAGPATAQQADPLGLIASGAIAPFWGSAPSSPAGAGVNRSFIEVASPVGENGFLHFIFFDTLCNRVLSIPVPQTVNDVDIIEVSSLPGTIDPSRLNIDGIFAVGTSVDGQFLSAIPDGTDLDENIFGAGSPITLRVHWFNVANDFARVVDPISITNAEAKAPVILPTVVAPLTWNAMRTGHTFFVPRQSTLFNTNLWFVCPSVDVVGNTNNSTPGVFRDSITGVATVPPLYPLTAFATSGSTIFGRVYDDDEVFLVDVTTNCQCLTRRSVTDLTSVYSDVTRVPDGSYTELTGGTPGGTADPIVGPPIVTDPERIALTGNRRSFALYRAVQVTDGSLAGGQIDDFGRAHGAAANSIGNITRIRFPGELPRDYGQVLRSPVTIEVSPR